MSSCESSEILDESAKAEEDPMPAENEPEEEQEQEEEPGDDNGEQADDGRREPDDEDGGKEADDRLKQLEGVAGDQRKQETLRADDELLAKDAARDDARQSSYLRKCAGAGGCDADAKEDQVEEDAEVESPHYVTATASVENADEKQGGGGRGEGAGGGGGGGGHESTRTQADEEEDERKGDGVDNDAPCTKDGSKIKSEEKTPSEDGERNGEGGGGGGGGIGGGREVGVEVGGVKKGDATITKKYLKAARALESNSQPASSSTVVTPKKTAQKVNSIIEGYVTKVSGGGGGADRASPQGKRAVRRSETESSRRGNISEIRERIERSASSAAQSPRKAGGKEEEAAGTNDGNALEERRRKKAEDWMNKITKVTKSSVDNGVQHSPASVNQTAFTSPTGKGSTSSAWKRKEEELKREKEQREAAQKQLEEKRKKLEEERRLARESSKKRNDPDRTDSAKKDLTLHGQKSTTTATRTTKTTTTTTSSTTATPDTKNSSHSTRLLSSANEDEEKMKKKQKVLESRVQPLSTEGLDAEGLEKMVNEMYKRIIILEEEKYDMETLLEKRENELHEIKVRMGESKGKFVKPQLKKVIKREEA